ncbi:hypothetical protein OIU74_011438 [Salix koriyanagi]|uniref:Uncharacterized protein n=1 Tax=Salix koriyanagi TaxID=2511006 RepID=A0A9Q0TF88_9ROSI|nr:hypothetical protein OIU74_011438 [Salix koriyanagi]KAJ6710571.1 hypothetical protein OIU74_011438 [Salix koriyanagi]
MGSGVEILKTRSTLTISINSHKRYLSEIMASSLNGLTVGDPLQENLMESPARDELSLQYSPMSEDFDDSRFCETPVNSCSPQSESLPGSPVSPYRQQRSHCGFSSAPYSSSFSSHGCSVVSLPHSLVKEARIPRVGFRHHLVIYATRLT